MSAISLNIYKEGDKKAIEKTYTVEGYDLMLGTVEEFVNIIDVDKLNDNTAVAGMILKGYSKIKPLIKDIFPEVTDEELNRVKVTELVQVIVDTGKAVAENFAFLKQGNLMRA